MNHLRRAFTLATLGALATAGAPALAQAYPNKPIRWVVGYPAGSGLDFVSRVVAESLAKKMGQQIVIDNRPGAAGAIAASSLSQSPADGYTLLSVDMGAYTLNPHLYSKLAYDPRRDFQMIGPMVTIPMVLYVPSSMNIDTVAQFVKHVKDNPGKLSFGSSGMGNPTHLTMELFRKSAGLEMTHVPYRGSPMVFSDLIAGLVHAFFTGPADGMPHVKSGKLKVLATATPSRIRSLPDIPTLRESGFDVGFPVWLGMAAAAGTPPDIVASLNKSLNEVMSQPDVVQRLEESGYTVDKRTSAKETDDFARAEYARWGRILPPMNIRLE